jgi:hypothetical protein
MHFYFIKNKKHFKNYLQREIYINNQEFLYETIQNQIKLVKADDLNCYEIIDSMLNFTSEENKGINFEIKKITDSSNKWPYELPPLLKLFKEYIYEICYYLIPIKKLDSIIFNEYFLYGNTITELDTKKKIEYIDNSIKYNKYRLKTILNLILGSMYNYDNSEKINIKTFLKILWIELKNVILEKEKYYSTEFYSSYTDDEKLYSSIAKHISEVEIKNLKLFFVSSIFDIETIHKESQDNLNVIKYEPVLDPYNNLPQPPEMPQRPIISQELQRYKMTSHINGKNIEKEKELKEYLKKEKEFKQKLKSYDKKLKDYNDKHLDQKLSPYFSVKLSRANSEINDKNSLRLSYSPLKVLAKSLTNFKSNKNKELLEKFEKEPYSRTYKQNKIKEEQEKEIQSKREKALERLRKRFEEINKLKGGGGKTKLSESDLKLKLALEADKFSDFAKKLSPSGKSPRQKYVGCDLNDNDPLTLEKFSDMHFKKIKYLSKIKTKLPDGKIIKICYDTIPFYNYILDCKNKGDPPLNLAIGRVPLTIEQQNEVFKKIKFFTKQPTLERNIDITKKYFLKAKYALPTFDINNDYVIKALINIGSIDFDLIDYNYGISYPIYLHGGPIISRDDILFEDTSDETLLLIEKGMANGNLLKVNTYPYWKSNSYTFPRNYKLLLLPSFTFSSMDSIQQLEKRTKVFNNRLRLLI